LLHPAAGQGFVAFHAHRGQKPEAVRRRSGARDPEVAFPATRFTPFEVFPSPTAAPHHCGRCLLAVTVPPKRADDPTR
jgi:hypothetical protein